MAFLPPSRRVIWYLGYSASKSAGAFTESYGQFQRVGYQEDPSYEVQGVLIDGFDSTTSSMKTLFPGARLGNLQHPGGSQGAFLTGLAHLYNLVPHQRRALHAGQCGGEVEGGRLPIADRMLNLQILTSGGYQYAPEPPPPTKSAGLYATLPVQSAQF